MEVVLASSPVDAGISCWDLHSGAEQLRYRSCASPPHGLVSVAGRFIASAQLRDSANAKANANANANGASASASASAPIFFWSWDKPQVEVKSFLAEPIGPLVSDSNGTYIIGGDSFGNIHLWELASGSLLNKWRAHFLAVTCLTLSSDESLLISGCRDGSIRVWSLLRMLDYIGKEVDGALYTYRLSGHSFPVTDVVSGSGLCNSIVISSSEDQTCKIWSLSDGKLLRNISFPDKIDAIAMDPAEHIFYAGGRDGKIYIAELNGESNPNNSYGLFILGTLSDHSMAITCLTFSTDGVTLVSGSIDGTVRIWNTRTRHITRILKHAKGLNNILIVKQPLRKSSQAVTDAQVSQPRKRMHLLLPPPLGRSINLTDGKVESKAATVLQPAWHDPEDGRYCSSDVMKHQIKELQQQGSSGAVEMEVERLRLECKRSRQMVQQWKKLYLDLQNVHVKEMMKVQLGDS